MNTFHNFRINQLDMLNVIKIDQESGYSIKHFRN